MQIVVVGTGKLASELLGSPTLGAAGSVCAWAQRDSQAQPSMVIHAGSGRELAAVIAYCEATRAPLIELATGSELDLSSASVPIVLCPNTNILMLKFMSMLEHSGKLFRNYQIKLLESHQASKSSVPGTALSMAQALGLSEHEIRSVRDVSVQLNELNIPESQLARHAMHQIVIQDGDCSLSLETRVYGAAPYADGVAQIVAAVCQQKLEARVYSVLEFIKNGWL
jgi:4-hydroxy-tetrahydrodipicolinate reductase